MGLGNFAWFSLFGALGRGFGAKGVFPLDASTMSAFMNHSWYGLVTALVAVKLGDPALFEKKPGIHPEYTAVTRNPQTKLPVVKGIQNEDVI